MDKPGLVSLYDSTEGDNWADNTNWLTNVPVGEWHGVTTSDGARGRVSGLLLMGNRLAGRIPSTIGDLTNLETLRLTDNSLRGEIPSELGSLKSLQVLELADNNLSGEIPPELGGLTNLQSLELFDNRLWGAIPSELGSLAQLQVLDVSDNRLSGEVPTELANLTKLEVLDLSDNSLTGAIPEGLGSLADLDTVYLDGNDLSGCIPTTWRSLDNEDFDDLGLPFCDVSLSSLAISPGQLDPEFDSGTSDYTAEVDQAQLTITPASLHSATFEFLDGNGEDIPDADETLDGHQVDIDYGVTTIKIKVVSQDGEESHTYTVEVSRLGEPDAPAIIDPIGAGPASLTVSWTAPTETRGGDVSSYDLRYIVSAATDKADDNWTMLDGAWTTGPLRYTIVGLIAGTQYDIQVRAATSAGAGPWSTTLTGTPNQGECSTEGAVSDATNNPGLASDCEVLLIARDALAGAASLDWQASISIGDWDGVEVSGTPQRVTGLDLEDSQLTGTIPSELGSLSQLQTLSLSQNQLTEEIPLELGRLTHLQSLSLWSNQLAGVIPPELSNLSNLTLLKLSQNQLTGCIPAGVRGVDDNDLGDLGLPFCDVLLSDLTISPRSLTPTFDPYHTEYTALDGPPLVTVTPVNEHDSTLAVLDENDDEIADADTTLAGHQVDVDNGATTIKVRVTSQDELSTRTYTVLVSRVLGAPTISVTPGGGFLMVTWVAPDQNEEIAVTAYDLRYIETSADETEDSNWTVVEDAWTENAGGDLRYVITGLSAGTQYDVQVRAASAEIDGHWSETMTGTPATPSVCVTGGAVTDSTNTGLASDCEALLAARDVLAKNASLNWATDTPMKGWDGVTVRGTPSRVTRLVLSNKSLGGTIPSELGMLSMLSNLNLRTNSLSGTIPAELGDLTNLVRLNLHTNQLSGPIPDLSSLTGLEELYLARNKLTGPVPTWLNGMTEMRELWLWGNDLSGTIPDLSGMTSLEKLKLAANDLEGGVPEASALPANLRWLIIQENPLGGTIPDLSGMTSLTVLWLHTNGLTGEIPASHLPSSVTSVNLHSNQLSGKIPDLSGLDKLQWLRLQSNRLSGMIPSTLGDMDSLTRLWLHENMLSGSIPAWIGSLTKLERLWLSDNMLSGQIPEELGELSDHSLVQWRLGGNDLTGCLPAGLADVEDNDLERVGLQVCSDS